MTHTRLAITDVDGTLLTPDKQLTPALHAAVSKLQEQGIALCLASSRHPSGMTPLVHKLKLDSPFAACNGSLILRGSSEVHFDGRLTPELMAAIVQILVWHDVHTLLYDAHGWWAPTLNDRVNHEARNVGLAPDVEGYHARFAEPVNKITLLAAPETILAAEAELDRELGSELALARTGNPHYLDITAAGIDKGHAVAWLAAHYGVSLAEVVVLGDGNNDVQMFTPVNAAGGISIAMGHAKEPVRAAATYVTGTNLEDGWASAIEKIVLRSSTHEMSAQRRN